MLVYHNGIHVPPQDLSDSNEVAASEHKEGTMVTHCHGYYVIKGAHSPDMEEEELTVYELVHTGQSDAHTAQ